MQRFFDQSQKDDLVVLNGLNEYSFHLQYNNGINVPINRYDLESRISSGQYILLS